MENPNHQVWMMMLGVYEIVKVIESLAEWAE